MTGIIKGDVELELTSLIAAYDKVILDRGLYNATVREGLEKRVSELRARLFEAQQQAAAREQFVDAPRRREEFIARATGRDPRKK